MSTHNIGFYEDLTKLSVNYHQIRTLFLLLSKSGLQHRQSTEDTTPKENYCQLGLTVFIPN